ncbi:MAG: ABC transporter permease, partial [Actinomycetota bacterium]|nr:ABC transporter permease [Actinomycetota bacterium]
MVYILRRLVLAASVVFAAITLVFVIFFVGPSDPAAALCGKNCTVARVAQINATLGLNQPAIVQFLHYLQGLFVGRDISSGGVTSHCGAPCLGWSFYQNTSVTKLVEQAFPVTLSIVAGAAFIFVVTGLTLGILAAKYRGTWIDRLLVGTSQVIASVPYYVWALLFFLYTMVVHAIFPSSGYTP